MAASTLLNQLRSRTLVDCDTLDASVAERLGPFQDCTSNQVIAFGELQKDLHGDLLRQAAETANKIATRYLRVTREALAVELSMVALALRMVPHIKGYVHIQANPFDAYSTKRTVDGALRLLEHFEELAAGFDKSRVCIKIPSTWEGLQACMRLESMNVSTLATTLFTIEQAAVAGEARCHYIAPYVHDLRAQIDASFVDPKPILQLCVDAQRYYKRHSYTTQVLPASLKSAEECMMMAGVHHITIAPPLLEALRQKSGAKHVDSLFQSDTPADQAVPNLRGLIYDEAAFRMAMTEHDDGYGEIKMIHAINIFCKMQTSLEDLLKTRFDVRAI